MLKKISVRKSPSYLSTYQLPLLSFRLHAQLPATIRPIWKALHKGDAATARSLATQALKEKRLYPASECAALKVGLAAAEWSLGAVQNACRQAGQALDLFPNQWSSHRILLAVYCSKQGYKAAYLHLQNLDEAGPVPAWDEPINKTEREVALAAWAWMLGEWEQVATHLESAYPSGLSRMPTPLQEDWLRLSLYRGKPDDAAAAAALLIEERPADLTDELLQTIVQNGWTKQALPLYRRAFASEPGNPLLRRRLVALCIREGEIEEARLLTKPGALSMAA